MPEKRGPDRRVTKTRRAIRQAFAALAAEKNINDITIREIAQEADINRKTFYNHYAGVYAVVDEIENDLCSQLTALLARWDPRRILEDDGPEFEELTEVVSQAMDLYGSLIIDNRQLIHKMGAMLEERMRPMMVRQYGLEEDLADLLLNYVLAGILQVYRYWYMSGRQRSPREITEVVRALCIRGISGMLDSGPERKKEGNP